MPVAHPVNRIRVFAVAAALSVLATPGLFAQVCLGGTDASPGWLAVAYGRASGNATLTGADFAWQLSRSFAVFGDGDATAYPAPDPRRDRLALGGAYTVIRSNAVDVCLTPAVERERIADLTIVRVPVGVALGWSTTFANGRARLGLQVEPFFVYSRKSIATFARTSTLVSGRTSLVLGYGRLMCGLEHERAFDNDARWHTRARLGFAF
jgi:hypothetical protein